MLEIKNLSALLLVAVLSSLLFSSAALAAFSVKPAKQGIFRFQLYPFTRATLTRSFEIENSYDYPLAINITPSDIFKTTMQITEANFTLGANETKTIHYVVDVKDAGTYNGGIIIDAKAVGGPGRIAYQTDLTIVATSNNILPQVFIVIMILAIAVPVFYWLLKKKGRKK